MNIRVLGAFFGLIAVIAASAATAEALPPPTGKPILTVSGSIRATNEPNAAVFDRSMLEALGLVTIETTTPWYEGRVRFEGVPLAKLMEVVGASGDRVVATALNDYSSEIPMEDLDRYNVILALKRNGEYMPVSDKGPLFIVYPYDTDADLKSETYYGRSVWQVSKLVVK